MNFRLLLCLIILPVAAYSQTPTPGFTAPDTVCVNTPVNIINTSNGASSFYWNFCVAGINTLPNAVNLGNPGNFLSGPTFSDIVSDNGQFYVFITNHINGGLVRLDFGNNLLNTPVANDLGNPSNALNSLYGKEGIQVIKNEGKWYVIVVGGNPVNGSSPRIVKVELGANITNNSPIGTNWGNLGNMLEPIDFHIFNVNGNWYGFTVNAVNNTITRFDFTNSFNNTPTGTNLGNIGGLNYPTGIFTIDDNGFYRVFICNGGDNTLTRLDFGNSLLNTPTGVNLGNPGFVLSQPRDLTILKLCNEIAGFAVNANNELTKMDFHNDLLSVPSGSSLGNIGNFNFPHSISKFFRVGNDLYTFITNVNNNTITRLQFAGCNSASIASSTLKDPPPIIYNTPGTYSINLSIDEGLPTQNSFCKQVVVVPELSHSAPVHYVQCNIDSIKIGTGIKNVNYSWKSGEQTDSIVVKTPGLYEITSSHFNCSNTDSIYVAFDSISLKSSNDTTICAGSSVLLHTKSYSLTAIDFTWSPAVGLDNPKIGNPTATPMLSTQYVLRGTDFSGCYILDTVQINVQPNPIITKLNDTTICHDKQLKLSISGGTSYMWNPDPSLSNLNTNNPVATPTGNSTYYFTVYDQFNCSTSDSIKLRIRPLPVFNVNADNTICLGQAVTLSSSGGDQYFWQPTTGISNNLLSNPIASPVSTTLYTVKIIESICKDSASLTTKINVFPLPEVHASSSNDINCNLPSSQLKAIGAITYLWQPGAGLSDSLIGNPIANVNKSTFFTVKGTDGNGCSNYDTVLVAAVKAGDLLFTLPNAFTPNGDGKNDCFGLKRFTGLFQGLQFSIYNRLGQRIFYSTNPADCWDGTYKGKMQDPGGFVYILKASSFCGVIFKKGVVMLIR
jgi:gliding motility-associated-like protein